MSIGSTQASLFAAFRDARVEYAVVGGMAVNAHGFIRGTRDLDVFIRPTMENASAVFAALTALGAPLEGLTAEDLLDDEAQFQLSTTSGGIDILSSIGEMTFDRVWRNRVEGTVDGIVVPFISKADLIENKLQVGRTLDIADAEHLMLIPDSESLHLEIEREKQ